MIEIPILHLSKIMISIVIAIWQISSINGDQR